MTATVTPLSREERLDLAHDMLANKLDSLVSGDDWIEALKFASKFRSRSFQNTMLIWLQHYQAHEAGFVPEPTPSLVAGYKQWKALGRQVEKGQPGYMIFAPVTARMILENGEFRRLERGEKTPPGVTIVRKMVGVRPAYVFDVSQTSGNPIPELPSPTLLRGQAPEGLREGILEQIHAAGFKTQTVASAAEIHGANGVTNYSTNTVSVRTDMDDAAQVKTLVHELAHVLLHDPTDPDRSAHRGRVEVEAESVAFLVLEAHGMATDDYSLPYVASWASSVEGATPREVVAQTADRCVSAANKILGALDSNQRPDGDPPGIAAVRAAAQNKTPATTSRPLTAQESPSTGIAI